MKSLKPPPLSILVFLSALAVLPVNMFVPSLPSMGEDFQVDFALVNLTVAGYAISTAMTHLVAGALSDRFGRKPVAMSALAVFTIASLGCSLAQDFWTFLVFRLMQSTVIAGYAVSLAVIRDTSEDRIVASRIGYVSSAWALAPMVGPSIGGALDGYFGWRSNFVLFAVLGLVGMCLVGAFFQETNSRRSSSFAQQLKGYVDLSRSVRFWTYVGCMAFGIGTLYAFLGGAPLVAEQLGGIPPVVLGFYMGWVPAGFILGSYLVGHRGARYSASDFMLAGRVLTCAGLLLALLLAMSEVSHPLAFFIPCITVGLGNGLTMPAANARILSIYPNLAGTASGFAASLTAFGGGLVAFFSGLLITPMNAHIAVLSTMLAASTISFVAAMLIFRADRLDARLAME